MMTTNLEAEQWQQRFANWQQSGLTVREWCQIHDVNYHSFKNWRTKLRDNKKPKRGFIEIATTVESKTKSGITINSGIFQVQIDQDFSETTLERLLTVLGRFV